MKKLRYYIALFCTVAGLHFSVSAQNEVVETEISGTVYESATGKPLAGAQITIPGVASATSDENGTYNLRKSYKAAVLLVNAPGFASKQIPVLGKSKIDIWLLDDSYRAKYVSVVMPFDKVNLLKNTSAVSTHENRNDYLMGAATLETVLQTGVNGVNVISRSGVPGSGANMFINGINSLNINNQPLIVVDGMIYENQPLYSLIGGNVISALSDIDVKDVDNVTVLKDGASIYGSKGANGVILINTIQAKEAATRINFHAYTGVNFEPNTAYKMLDASGYKTYLTDMLASKGMSDTEIQALPYINTNKPVTESWGISGNKDYYRYNQSTNWQDEVFNNSMNTNYHLNITGGNEKTLFAFGVGYLGHEGIIDNTSFNRYSTRANAKIKMTDWFQLNTNVSFVYSERALTFEGMNRNFNPLYAGLLKAPFTSPYVYNVLGEETPNLEDDDVFNISNPRSILNNSSANNNRFRFFGSLNAIISFSNYLNAEILFGLTSDKVTKERLFLPDAGIFHPALPSADVTNESQQLRSGFSQVNTEGRLTYNRSFNNVHDVAARLGSRILSGNYELDWGKAFNTSSDEMQTLGDGKNTMALVGGSLGSWKSVSNYLNVEYGNQNRYYFSLNAALDGSSRFGKNANGLKISNHVFGFFPSINAAWVVTGEEFMKNQQFVDVLKMRAGYAVTGNDDIGNYSARHYYLPQSLLGAYGLVRGNIPNSELKWETNRKATIGFDASFLRERLNVSLDLYSSVTQDLIGVQQINTASGMSYAIKNDGSLSNQGIDLAVNARIIDQSELKWDVSLNASTYKNKLQTLSSEMALTEIAGAYVQTKIGAPLSQFFGYQTQGILSSDAKATEANLAIQYPDGTKVPFTAGDVHFVDRDRNNVIDEKDMTVIGDPNPDVFGSFTSSVQWKRFTLNTLFNYSIGGDVYNALRANLESMSGTDNQTAAILYRWKTNGQQTDIPKAVWGDPMGNSRFSDRWIEDGSFLRLKTVTLAYNLPLKIDFINSVQLYVTANNLVTFTNYLGYDPEFSTSQNPLYFGIDTGVSPQPRSVLLGVKIGL